MHRTTRTITLVLVSSGLILHGCADDEYGDDSSTTQRSNSSHSGVHGFFRSSSGGSRSHSSGSSVHSSGTVRGGFGGHASSGSS